MNCQRISRRTFGKKLAYAKYEYTAAYNGFSVILSHSEYKIIKNDMGSMVISDIYELGSVEDDLEEEITLNPQTGKQRFSVFLLRIDR